MMADWNNGRREYDGPGGYRVIDTGAVVNPDKIKVIAGHGKIELRYACDAAGAWYGAFAVYACGFGTGFAVVFPAEALRRDYGIEPRNLVDWVEEGRQPRGRTKGELLRVLKAWALDWLQEQIEDKPEHEERIQEMIDALRSAKLEQMEREEVERRAELARRPAPVRKVEKKASVEQLSLF